MRRAAVVMARLIPVIRAVRCFGKDVDARHKAGHDEIGKSSP
jgi:hypothetical protein